MIQIKHRFSGKVLFEHDGDSIKIAVNVAVQSGANLSGANLSRADLYGADLSGANLSRADLSGANLSRADLYGADLYGANLSGANLSGADLSGADLSGANLSRANIKQSEINKLSTCPRSGDFIAWKKSDCGAIIKLKIPACVRRTFNSQNRKCRAEAAIVLDIFQDGKSLNSVHSQHDPSFVYTVGEWVFPDEYDADCFVDCSHGIHFFMTMDEALEW